MTAPTQADRRLAPSAQPSPPVRYDGRAYVTDDGLGRSVETTVWSDLPRRGDGEADALDAAARRAAEAYAGRIQRMSLGLLGTGRPGQGTGAGPSLFLQPFGIPLLEIMGFGALEAGRQGEYYFPVERGILSARRTAPERMGRLYFRWWRDGRDEVFQTEVRDFTPRFMGLAGDRLGLWLYKITQMNAHRLVMWRYHKWVARERRALLALDGPPKPVEQLPAGE